MKTILMLLALAIPAAAQDMYARALYTKWKPGMREEGQLFIKNVAMKVAANQAKADPAFLGQVTMSRVHPSAAETGIDRLRLVITSTPPNLGATGTPAAWLDGTGLTPAQYSAKLASYMDSVKTEIWRSVFRYGSLQQGDFVTVSMADTPAGRTAEHLSYIRDYESAMRAQLVKDGAKKGLEGWRVLLAATAADYDYVALTVNTDSDSVFKTFPSRSGLFQKVHPGKDYHAYIEQSRAVSRTIKTMVFRVDSALWK